MTALELSDRYEAPEQPREGLSQRTDTQIPPHRRLSAADLAKLVEVLEAFGR